ncbi:hypothetical protein PYCCODRAFT_1469456 [Trametes coccinea BRFM310]|uniref:Uncharacterized protein n=1 Tax=Trametes coccinea (strain BRFM310) TaxID=1353009 RepID=A0A1Y2IGT0_TRAC3|nr:hypothetical protein PYCCODRAFT_1469456 [Trametes coccinea BRFM310]
MSQVMHDKILYPWNDQPALDVNHLYICMYSLPTIAGRKRFHWSLVSTAASESPSWCRMYHATDFNRHPMDLYREIRDLNDDPRASRSMLVIMKISSSPGEVAMELFSSYQWVPLMDQKRIPWGEERWTCRVWVKEVLKVLQAQNQIRLPSDIESIERWCMETASRNVHRKGRAKLFNDFSWLTVDGQAQNAASTSNRRGAQSTTMEIDSTAGRPYYGTGPKPMIIDSTGRGDHTGSKPMVVDPTTGRGYYTGSKPMVIDPTTGRRYYTGSKPMVTDSTAGYPYPGTAPPDANGALYRRG